MLGQGQGVQVEVWKSEWMGMFDRILEPANSGLNPVRLNLALLKDDNQCPDALLINALHIRNADKRSSAARVAPEYRISLDFESQQEEGPQESSADVVKSSSESTDFDEDVVTDQFKRIVAQRRLQWLSCFEYVFEKNEGPFFKTHRLFQIQSMDEILLNVLHMTTRIKNSKISRPLAATENSESAQQQ